MAQKYIAYIFRLLFIVIATILFVDSCLSGFSRPLFVTYSIGIITCNLYCLWRVRKNVNLLIVFSLILFFNYSITIANYLVHFDNNSFVSPIDSFYSIKSLNLLFAFNYLLVYAVPRNVVETKKVDTNNYMSWNKMTSYCALLILVYILIFEFVKPDITGERGSGTPIYEYSIIIALFACLTLSTRKYIKYFFLIVFLAFIIQEVVYGGRIVALQYLIIIYIFFISPKYKLRQIAPLLIIGYIFFSLIGAVRGNLLMSTFSLVDIIRPITKEFLALDTAYSAYYTSEMFIRLVEQTPWHVRLDLLVDFVKSIFIGESGVLHDRALPRYVYSYYWHCFGGMLPYYFYFYLGVLGIVISILLLKLYFNIINKVSFYQYPLYAMIGLYIVIATPRWYLYSPLGLFRSVIFIVLIYCVFKVINRLFNLLSK